MRSSDVTFRTQDVPIETRDPNDDDIKTMDIIEIRYPDGKVVAFPADMKSPETGIRYRDMFRGKYDAFKNGEPDPDRVAQLEREIEERKSELDGMRKKAPDDKPVQENLGYGAVKRDENPHDATKPDPKRLDQPAVLGKPAVEPARAVSPAKPAEPAKPKETA